MNALYFQASVILTANDNIIIDITINNIIINTKINIFFTKYYNKIFQKVCAEFRSHIFSFKLRTSNSIELVVPFDGSQFQFVSEVNLFSFFYRCSVLSCIHM